MSCSLHAQAKLAIETGVKFFITTVALSVTQIEDHGEIALEPIAKVLHYVEPSHPAFEYVEPSHPPYIKRGQYMEPSHRGRGRPPDTASIIILRKPGLIFPPVAGPP
jgi:hypothetical protein